MVPPNSTPASQKRSSAACRAPTPYAWLSNAAASSETRRRPVAVELPDHIKVRDAAVRPHRLETYDQLKDQTNNDQTNKDDTDE